MSKIALIYMGGTFGCVGNPLQPMPAEAFIAILQRECTIHLPDQPLAFYAAPSIQDSSALNAQDWLKLAHFITQLSQQGIYNFVIVHGTDTLSYGAALLYHLFGQRYRIVFSGSQLPLLNALGTARRVNSDAWSNLTGALACFKQMSSGVWVYFAGSMIHAANAYKRHTTAEDAFAAVQSDDVCALACYDQLPSQSDALAAHIRLLNWVMTPMSAELLDGMLHHLCAHPPHIVLLHAFGSGNLPYSASLQNTLNQLSEHGCQVVITSQVPQGELSGHYQTGAWLRSAGVTIARYASPSDAYAQLILNYLMHYSCQ